MTSIRLAGNFICTMLFVLCLRWLQYHLIGRSDLNVKGRKVGKVSVWRAVPLIPLNKKPMSKHVLQSLCFKSLHKLQMDQIFLVHFTRLRSESDRTETQSEFIPLLKLGKICVKAHTHTHKHPATSVWASEEYVSTSDHPIRKGSLSSNYQCVISALMECLQEARLSGCIIGTGW